MAELACVARTAANPLCNGCRWLFIYLISDAELTGTSSPPVGRKYLTDAYRYSSQRRWYRIADVPQSAVAGVGSVTEGKLLVFGGDDGSNYARQFELKYRHPGFFQANIPV